jgi:hypothetical protein
MTDNKVESLSIRSFARMAGRILLIVISSLSICILIVVGVLLLWSPGKMKPFVDENGNPSEGSISNISPWFGGNSVVQDSPFALTSHRRA